MDSLSPQQKVASVSRKMVRWGNALEYRSLPPEVQHEAKRALVDGIGCAIGGYGCDAHVIAQRVLQKLGGTAEAKDLFTLYDDAIQRMLKALKG